LIKTGSAFDLVANTTVMKTMKISKKVNEKDMKVTLKNRSKETKEIVVIHEIHGNWTISGENTPYAKKSAYKIEFVKSLKAGEEFDLVWTERISY
jgi:hypothetical protein